MKTIKTLMAILAITAVAACGSKNKKTTDQPATDQSASATKDDAPAADTSDNGGEDTGPTNPNANLNNKILFEFDSSDLGDSARAALEENARWLKEDGERTILIEGHTDEQGTSEYNLGLGDRRARAAKDYLVALGITAERIRIITYGEEKPESPEDAENRRSVFIETKSKK